MNSLEEFLRVNRIDEIEAMNQLQDAGPISDLCVWARDVPESQCGAAIERLCEIRGLA